METTIAITFYSEWFVGSGFGDGHVADSILTRDSQGLLFIPGRAIKGALREGARRLALVRADLAKIEAIIFGTHCQPEKSGNPAKSFNQPGFIRVGNGRLPREIEELLLTENPEDRRKFINDLTILKTQTALNEKGVAKTGSLRVIEVGIPGLVFSAEISLIAPKEIEDTWLKLYLAAVCAMVKSLGGHRARGLGKCRVAFQDEQGVQEKTVLPPVLDFKGIGG
jgi:CRISPR-associated protein Csx10